MKKTVKANTPGFWNNDFKTTKTEIKNGYKIKHQKNSVGRRRILEIPLEEDKLLNCIYPDGGCNLVGGIIFCSFDHIDWSIPRKNLNRIE